MAGKFCLCSSRWLTTGLFLYQGKGDIIIDSVSPLPFDLCEKVIITFCSTISEECNVYMDRYFTTMPIIDELQTKGLHGIGTF